MAQESHNSSGRSSRHEPEAAQTFYWAAEIEQNLVSLCFYNPELTAEVYRELDPGAHITQPHLRIILEAIDLAYRELGGVSDFAILIQVLLEMGKLEEVGQAQGVIDVLEAYRYGNPDGEAKTKIFEEYIRLLKMYAEARAKTPPEPVYRFREGRMNLFVNKLKGSNGRGADVVGEAKVAGVLYLAEGWVELDSKGEKFMRIRLTPQK